MPKACSSKRTTHVGILEDQQRGVADVRTQPAAGSHRRAACVRRCQVCPERFCFAWGKCDACLRELGQSEVKKTDNRQAEYASSARPMRVSAQFGPGSANFEVEVGPSTGRNTARAARRMATLRVCGATRLPPPREVPGLPRGHHPQRGRAGPPRGHRRRRARRGQHLGDHGAPSQGPPPSSPRGCGAPAARMRAPQRRS